MDRHAANRRPRQLAASAAASIDLQGPFRQTRSRGLLAAWRLGRYDVEGIT